jgi:hypothetical protein
VVVGAACYLGAVGVPLARDLTVVWPASRAAYRAARTDDERLFAFLRTHGIDRAYTYDYWLGPRLTFDAGLRIIVAEPYRDRYPPHTAAVDASPHPAYVVQTSMDPDRVERWTRGIGSHAERAEVGPYTVFWSFATPTPVSPLPRAAWTVSTSAGVGDPESLADGRLDTGWSSAPGPPRTAWVEVDLGRPRRIAGVTLLSDHAQRIPQILEVIPADGATSGRRTGRPLVRLDTGGLTVDWRNGAPRTVPSRTATVRFPPIEAQRLRLRDAGRAGVWAVAELFLLAPAEAPVAATRAARLATEGERLEASGALGPALVRYHAAMKAAPDDPRGYAEYARLSGQMGLRARFPAVEADHYARLGLTDEALASYARLAADLGPERTHVELTRREADLAGIAGDPALARHLEAQAARVAAPPAHPTATVFGRVVELTGYDVSPAAVPPGRTLEVTYRWRLLAEPRRSLVAYVHIRREGGPGPRLGDDHSLPPPIRGLAVPQTVVERRVVQIPPDAPPGRYRVLLGVWSPESGDRLHRWWRGWLPTPGETVELGAFEVLPPP